jgi:hypothetical protein
MNDQTRHRWTRGIYGSSAVMAAVILLISLVLPNFIKARATSCANACLNNLRQIDAAANQFALEKGKKTGDPVDFPDDLTPYIKLNSADSIPGCPAGGRYFLWRIGQMPK